MEQKANRMWPKKRVRVHLADPHPGVELPSVEGVLVSKRGRELTIAVASLVFNPDADPVPLQSRWLVIPRERVAFYEVLS